MNMNYGILQYCSSDAAKEQQQVLTSGHVSLFLSFACTRSIIKYPYIPHLCGRAWTVTPSVGFDNEKTICVL